MTPLESHPSRSAGPAGHHPPNPAGPPASPAKRGEHHPHPPKPPSNSAQPHHKKKKGSLVLSVLIGTIFTLIIGFVLSYLKITINVILPVLAPIWVGSITLVYTMRKD